MVTKALLRLPLAALLVTLGPGLLWAQGMPPAPADPDGADVPPPPPPAPTEPRPAPPPGPTPPARVVVPPAAPEGPPPAALDDEPAAAPAPRPSGRDYGDGDDGPGAPRRRARSRFHLAYWGVTGGALVPLKGKGVYRDLGAGFTFGAIFGLNFGPTFALEMSIWGSGHSDPTKHEPDGLPLNMVFAQADLRYNLMPSGGRVVPYLLGGLGLGALLDGRVGIFDNEDVQRTAIGGNLRVAAGLDVRPSRSTLIGVRLGLQNLLFGSPQGGRAISCGDSYLLALAAEVFLAARF